MTVDRAHIYEYLCAESAKEKYLSAHRRHATPPKDSDSLFSLLTKSPVECDSHNIPLLTWNHVMDFMQRNYGDAFVGEHHVVLMKQNKFEIPEHTHTYFEIIYVLSGSCTHFINQNAMMFSQGDFCIFPPAVRHIQYNSDDSLALKILISPSAFTDICAGLLKGQDTLSRFLLDGIYNGNGEQFILFCTEQNVDVREQMLDMYYEMLSADSHTNCIVTGMLMTLLARLSRECQASLKSVPAKNMYYEIRSYLQKNSSTITLEELASHLHYTVPYCSRYIKKLFGCTFSQLLKQLRFQQADLLLQNSSLTINQISRIVGYENPENFMRAFKKRHQMTPSQYRELHKWNPDELFPS